MIRKLWLHMRAGVTMKPASFLYISWGLALAELPTGAQFGIPAALESQVDQCLRVKAEVSSLVASSTCAPAGTFVE